MIMINKILVYNRNLKNDNLYLLRGRLLHIKSMLLYWLNIYLLINVLALYDLI